jgi:hypothetical protein
MGTHLGNAKLHTLISPTESLSFLHSGEGLRASLRRPVAAAGDRARWATIEEAAVRRAGAKGCQRQVGVFKKSPRRDAAGSVGSFDEVVARLPNVLVAEGIGERDRLGKLPGADQEARAIHIPSFFADHDFLTTNDGGPVSLRRFAGSNFL